MKKKKEFLLIISDHLYLNKYKWFHVLFFESQNYITENVTIIINNPSTT